jgi:mono/diheme cytochrome c family protein
MRQSAHVVSQQEFDDRLAELREQAAGDGGGGEEPQETDGEQLFTEAAEPAACGSCHTLSAAGTNGTTGPNLDDSLRDMDDEQIREAIVNPEADIAEGFSGGLMPNFGESLSDEQVDALVEYLSEVSGE